MKSLTLYPLDEQVNVPTKSTLLDALLAKELNVPMACGGNGLCATCHVFVKKGGEGLTAKTQRERQTLSFISGTKENSRLACQCHVLGDGVEVEVPEGMYIEKAEDLLSLLGTRSPADILHPVTGKVLVAQGKLITRSQIEALKKLNFGLDQLRDSKAELFSSRSRFVGSNPITDPPKNLTQQPTPQPTLGPKLPQRKTPQDGMNNSPITGFGSDPLPQVNALHEEFRPGNTVGKCLIVEQIGKGGSGIVFRAIHRSLNIPVAVKVLNIHSEQANPKVLDQLRNEAQLLAQLNHPNVVRVWDYEDTGPHPYMVLEYVEGWSLRELIEQSGRVCQDKAISIMLQIGDALRESSRLGIVHRDVKPGNILLSKDGVAKLADLGLAMMQRERREPEDDTSDVSLFRLEGTVAYISPEQARGEPSVDHRSDIYSLGASFYHAVTGRLPFRGKNRREVLEQHFHAPVVPPHRVVPGVAISVSEVICRMLAKNPAERYADYETLVEDFELLEEESFEGEIASLDTNIDASRRFAGDSRAL
ncbi:MAG: protein kinase [Gemmataceae bacterium]